MADFLLYIDGMTCGTCAARVGRALQNVTGVTSAAVNLTTGIARVEGNIDGRADDLIHAVENAGYGGRILESSAGSADALRQVHARGERQEEKSRDRLIYGALFGIPAIALGFALHNTEFLARRFGLGFHSGFMLLEMLLATAAVAITGWPFFRGAWRALRHGSANMDVLVALGAGIAWLASAISLFAAGIFTSVPFHPAISEFHAAVAIILLVALGKYLEARAKRVAASSVGTLAAQTADNATRILPDGSTESAPAEQLRIGDRIQILAHQRIPVDGEVIQGAGSADLSVVTGESIPVEVKSGTSLPGGATLSDGRIVLRATAAAGASTVARIWNLVNNAQASKTHIQGLADKVAGIFVPIVIALAILTFFGWRIAGAPWQFGLIAAIATIVIACPCAMGLATPTAITVALGTAAKRGILFTRASALERAGKIHTVVFDKTGTLTEGKPSVATVEPFNNSGVAVIDLLRIAASLEQYSDHPLARAIVNAAQQDGLTLMEPESFSSTPGGGIRGNFPGNGNYAAGSAQFLETIGAGADFRSFIDAFAATGQSTVAIADLNRKAVIGVIGLRDALREESLAALQQLRAQRKHIVVLSGDSQAAVQGALRNAPVDTIHAGMSPEAKARTVEELRQANAGVAFIGDGVNDGPALAAADLGIAMAGGTDLAKAAGDVLLVGNRIAAVPEVLDISRRTLRIIRQNLFWAFAYNVAAIPLAMFGILPPGVAAGAMMASSLTVVGNALRLRRTPVYSSASIAAEPSPVAPPPPQLPSPA